MREMDGAVVQAQVRSGQGAFTSVTSSLQGAIQNLEGSGGSYDTSKTQEAGVGQR